MGWTRRLSLVATAVLAVGLLGSAKAEASNDTMATAQGPVTHGIVGAINTENDVDWYFMYALGSTQLDIALTGVGPEGSCQHWTAGLKDSNGYELSWAQAPFNQVDHIRYTVPDPGTYYLEVTGFFCEDVGNYRIDIAASPELLTSPPYVPPPAATPAAPSDSSACRAARQRVASLSSRLRHATSRRQRNRLRAKLRQARSTAASLC